jgi:hypothetical protein
LPRYRDGDWRQIGGLAYAVLAQGAVNPSFAPIPLLHFCQFCIVSGDPIPKYPGSTFPKGGRVHEGANCSPGHGHIGQAAKAHSEERKTADARISKSIRQIARTEPGVRTTILPAKRVKA